MVQGAAGQITIGLHPVVAEEGLAVIARQPVLLVAVVPLNLLWVSELVLPTQLQ